MKILAQIKSYFKRSSEGNYPQEITEQTYNKMLHSDNWNACPGDYYFQSEKSATGEKVWVGCDNSTGDMWTEDFPSKKACINWLTDKSTTVNEY